MSTLHALLLCRRRGVALAHPEKTLDNMIWDFYKP